MKCKYFDVKQIIINNFSNNTEIYEKTLKIYY